MNKVNQATHSVGTKQTQQQDEKLKRQNWQ